MTALAPVRRASCAAISIAIAALLFHGPLAASVVTRGDDALRGGDLATALRSYRKALMLDPSSAIAADRLAFHLALVHSPVAAASAIAIASDALRLHPRDSSLLADRGFGELQLRAWRAARADFTRAGSLGNDARYDYLAARLALRLADLAGARSAAARAEHDDPAFVPARSLLASLR